MGELAYSVATRQEPPNDLRLEQRGERVPVGQGNQRGGAPPQAQRCEALQHETAL